MTTKKPKTKNAMHSLWGSKARADAAIRVAAVLRKASPFLTEKDDELILALLDAVKPTKALSGNVGGQQREQTVYTPKWIINQLGPIALDPCTTEENPTGAANYLTEADDGLLRAWRGFDSAYAGGLVYVNPPYNNLEAWLAKCMDAGDWGAKIIALIPVRTQRVWWQAAFRDAKEVRACRPFAFEGHAQAFPAPLCMMSWNCVIPDIQTPPTKKYPNGQPLFI